MSLGLKNKTTAYLPLKPFDVLIYEGIIWKLERQCSNYYLNKIKSLFYEARHCVFNLKHVFLIFFSFDRVFFCECDCLVIPLITLFSP